MEATETEASSASLPIEASRVASNAAGLSVAAVAAAVTVGRSGSLGTVLRPTCFAARRRSQSKVGGGATPKKECEYRDARRGVYTRLHIFEAEKEVLGDPLSPGRPEYHAGRRGSVWDKIIC